MQIDNGVYRARVVEGVLTTTQDGKEQLAVSFELLEGITGETIAWYGFFTEKSRPITFRALQAMGFQGDDLTDLSSIQNSEVRLTIKNEAYNGKTRSKVEWVNSLDGPALQGAMEPDRARTFAAQMKGEFRAFKAAEGKPKVTGKPEPRSRTSGVLSPEPPPPSEDPGADIPF